MPPRRRAVGMAALGLASKRAPHRSQTERWRAPRGRGADRIPLHLLRRTAVLLFGPDYSHDLTTSASRQVAIARTRSFVAIASHTTPAACAHPRARHLPVPTVKPIPSLDGIRAVSVTLVFVAHAGFADRVPGGLGVTIFFFLSGFLITTLLRQEFAQTSDVSVKAFYMRRFLRLGPPLLLTLLIAYSLVLAGVHPGGATVQGFLAQMFYFANYFALFFDPGSTQVPYGTGILWSLAVEEHFYLVFPIVFLLLARRLSARRMAALFLATCVAVLAWRLYLAAQPGFRVERTYFASDTRLDSILFGCIFALGFDVTRDRTRSATTTTRDTMLFVAGAATLIATLVIRNGYFRETLRYTLQGIALMPLFYCAIVYADTPVFRPLNWAWMRRIGVFSYSIYLIHYIAIANVERNTLLGHQIWFVLLAAGTISILYAAAVERWIESRLRVLRRRFH